MRKIEAYPKEERDRIIQDYLQSGLSMYTYCRRPENRVSETTLNRWMDKYKTTTKQKHESQLPISTKQHDMVCYTFGGSRPSAEDYEGTNQRQLSLEEMILFHKQIHECCCILQQMDCSRENTVKMKHLLEVL